MVRLLRHLIHTQLQVVDLGDQTVFLQLHEHLLVDRRLILVPQRRELRGKIIVLLLLLGLVGAQFLFLLLHAPVVDLLEVSLLAQFIIRRSGLLGDDPSLVQLFLQHGKLIRQLSILAIDLWDLW